MMARKIVFRGKSKSGKEIVIRYPQKEDLKAMWEYINTLSKERTFIGFQGEKIFLEDEEKYLNSFLEKISKRKAVKLLVICEGKIIGISDIMMKEMAEKHIGVFGITMAKKMYQKFGFVEYGVLPKGVKLEKGYADNVYYV